MKNNIRALLILFSMSLVSCDEDKEYRCDSTNRVGAVCKDGTKSNSVGSGTCSGHGGVDYWLCK